MTYADVAAGLRRLFALWAALLLASCGSGGGGGDPTPTPTPAATPPAALALPNAVPVTIDDGPAALGTGSDASRAANEPFVSVTLCAPGTSTCQTIDHVLVDTGSVGLRITREVLGPSLLSALPTEGDEQSNPVGECYGYVDGYVFGSVRQADLMIGGEAASNLPIQVVGDSGQFASVPPSCSSGGGVNISTVKAMSANGILGIGLTATDCGRYCTVDGGHGAGIYYDCPATGCGAIIARAAATGAPFQQVINPVVAMAVDNNGSILELPAIGSTGSRTASGTLYFGIGTQDNNSLSGATVLMTTMSDDDHGGGRLTTTYQGRSLPDSFIDSGSNAYFFSDNAITICTSKSEAGFYCPSSATSISSVIRSSSGVGYSAAFSLRNAHVLFGSSNAALPGLGADPAGISSLQDISSSFDFGLPFFFGHRVYTGIEGRAVGGAGTPFVAVF